MDDKTQNTYSTLSHDSPDTVSEAVPALKMEEHYTYADYITWDDDKRWELINGKAYAMSAPMPRHQEILGELYYQLRGFLKGKPCKVYVAPFDVRLNADTGDDTVLQPDILVICDREKITKAGSVGAPDMVIEILSPSTAIHDKVVKMNLYKQYGVREYWIVDPDSKTLSVYILEDDRYFAAAYAETDTAPVHVLEGCAINLAEVFSEE